VPNFSKEYKNLTKTYTFANKNSLFTYLSYLAMGLFLLHFVTLSSWNKVQMEGNEKLRLLELFLLTAVMQKPAEPQVHGIPVTYEAALSPLG
jgi:hypothetical protein